MCMYGSTTKAQKSTDFSDCLSEYEQFRVKHLERRKENFRSQ